MVIHGLQGPGQNPAYRPSGNSFSKKCLHTPAILSGEQEGTRLPHLVRHYVNFHVVLVRICDISVIKKHIKPAAPAAFSHRSRLKTCRISRL
jgi:hypothetical protein